jgi:hypothetical protein
MVDKIGRFRKEHGFASEHFGLRKLLALGENPGPNTPPKDLGQQVNNVRLPA